MEREKWLHKLVDNCETAQQNEAAVVLKKEMYRDSAVHLKDHQSGNRNKPADKRDPPLKTKLFFPSDIHFILPPQDLQDIISFSLLLRV